MNPIVPNKYRNIRVDYIRDPSINYYMGEIINENVEQLEIETESIESRFGNIKETLDTMETGAIERLGTIDELYPDIISPHTNVVEVVDVHQKGEHKPQIVIVEQTGHKPIKCVFKPFSGENPDMKIVFPHDLFIREIAAYEIDRHFGLDLIPPTTIRNIEGEYGSLQLFMDPEEYLPAGHERIWNKLDESEEELIQQSTDLRKLAILDAICVASDRHTDNFLYKVKHEGDGVTLDTSQGEPEIIAIDNAISLDTNFYVRAYKHKEILGPYRLLTDNLFPVETPIPDDLIDMLKAGLARRNELDVQLDHLNTLNQKTNVSEKKDINDEEIETLWARVEEMINRKIFISAYNSPLMQKSI